MLLDIIGDNDAPARPRSLLVAYLHDLSADAATTLPDPAMRDGVRDYSGCLRTRGAHQGKRCHRESQRARSGHSDEQAFAAIGAASVIGITVPLLLRE